MSICAILEQTSEAGALFLAAKCASDGAAEAGIFAREVMSAIIISMYAPLKLRGVIKGVAHRGDRAHHATETG